VIHVFPHRGIIAMYAWAQHGLQKIEDIEMVYVRAESGC
jgi:hypothetical protein